jgi:hypothetical protein
MARTRRTDTNGRSQLLGSFMSMFGFHQVNICKTEDNTFYCNFMRIFKTFIAIIMIFSILYIIFLFVFPKSKILGGKLRK